MKILVRCAAWIASIYYVKEKCYVSNNISFTPRQLLLLILLVGYERNPFPSELSTAGGPDLNNECPRTRAARVHARTAGVRERRLFGALCGQGGVSGDRPSSAAVPGPFQNLSVIRLQLLSHSSNPH